MAKLEATISITDLMRPKIHDGIPSGAIKLECYLYKNEFIVLGEPELLYGKTDEESDNPSHNCDAMGCGLGDHVIFRAPSI